MKKHDELIANLSGFGVGIKDGKIAKADLDLALAAVNAKALQKTLQKVLEDDWDKFTDIISEAGCDCYSSEPGMFYQWYGEMGVKKSTFHKALEKDVIKEGSKTLISLDADDHSLVVYATDAQLEKLQEQVAAIEPEKEPDAIELASWDGVLAFKDGTSYLLSGALPEMGAASTGWNRWSQRGGYGGQDHLLSENYDRDKGAWARFPEHTFATHKGAVKALDWDSHKKAKSRNAFIKMINDAVKNATKMTADEFFSQFKYNIHVNFHNREITLYGKSYPEFKAIAKKNLKAIEFPKKYTADVRELLDKGAEYAFEDFLSKKCKIRT